MRVIVRISIAFIAVILLLIGAAWFVPQTLDWSRYRSEIATLASRQIGRVVHIDGPVSLTLLPQPALLVSRVSVASGESGVSMSVKVARLRVALWPLFAGKIDALDLTLRGLDLRMPGPLNGRTFAVLPPAWLHAQSAQVEEGRVAIGNLVFDGIEATLSAGELTGGYRASGTTSLSGQAWRFTGSLGQAGGDGSAPVNATLDGQDALAGVGLTLSGQVGGDGAFAGGVVATGPDLSRLIPAPPLPFHADGRLSIASGLAAADELQVAVGGTSARVAVAFRLQPAPRLDVAVAASNLNLDLWLPFIRHRPSSMVLGVDVSSEAASLAGGTLRHLRAALDVAPGGIDIRELRASLPGDAELQLIGHLAPDGGFAGDGRLAMPVVRSTLAWFNAAAFVPLPHLPDDVIRTSDIAGHLVYGDGLLTVSRLTGALDGQPMTGEVALRTVGRAGVRSRLRIRQLDFSSLAGADYANLIATAAIPKTFDLDLRLAVERAIWPDGAVAALTLDGVLDSGGIALRQFALQDDDVKVSASGALLADGRFQKAHLQLDAISVQALMPALPAGVRDDLARVPSALGRKLAIEVTANGKSDALGVSLRVDLDDLRLEADPVIDVGARRLEGALTMRHPGASRLAETFGLRGAPAWLGDGSFGLVASITATPGAISVRSFDLTAGGLHGTGSASVDLTASPVSVTAQVDADTVPLPVPFAHSLDPFRSGWLGGWSAAIDMKARAIEMQGLPPLRDALAKVTLSDGVFGVQLRDAKLGGGSATGSIRFEFAARPPRLAVNAHLERATLNGPVLDASIDLRNARIAGNVTLNAAGYSPSAMVATLGGAARLALDDGQLVGVDLGALNEVPSTDRVHQALAGGVTPFDRMTLTAAISGGLANLSGTKLQSAAGAIDASGSIDLVASSADLHLLFEPRMADAPQVGLRLNGPLDSPRRTPELAALAQWQAQRLNAEAEPAAPTR